MLVLPNPASAISSAFTSPLKLFEYMAAGRPIVASDLPAIREVLTADVNALLVAPGNAPALARRHPPGPVGRRRSAARLAAAATAAAREYTWERRAERLEALLAERRRARGDDLRSPAGARALSGLPTRR